jgi:hypothetical protein
MGITVKFPIGSDIFTTNFPAETLTVATDGSKIESTSLVANNAFSASGIVDNNIEPGSGPAGYACNRCTF